MAKTLSFAVEGVELLDELSDSQFATAEIEAFSTGDNLHDLICSEETLRKTAHTIFEKPVIFEVDPNFYDFGTHNEGVTVPAGFVVSDTAEFVTRDDGRTTLKVIAKIWKKYARDFMKVFEFSSDKNKSVSVEIEIYEKTEDDSSGASEMLSFAYAAITVIGDFFTPASPGANIQLTSFSKEDIDAEKREYSIAYQREFSKYASLDFSIPDDVKLNSQNGLDLRSEGEYGGTAVSVSLAKYIVENEKADFEKVRQIAKYFARKTVDRPLVESGDSWITWQLYGGDASVVWSKTLSKEMDLIDEEIMAYFDSTSENDISRDDEKAKDKKENSNMSKKIEEKEIEEPIVAEFEEESEEEAEDEDVMMEEDAEEESGEEENEEEDEEEMSFAMTARNIDYQLQQALEEEKDSYGYGKYWVETHDDEYAYVYCYEDGKSYRMKYSSTDDSVSIEISMAEEIVYEPMLVKTAEAKKVEFAELVEFKNDILSKQFEFEVNSVLNEVLPVLGEDAVSVAREESKNFTLETLDGWKNSVKAEAFAASKDVVEEDDGIIRMETLFNKKADSESLWN